MKTFRKRLWYVEGINALRHRVGDHFWATTSSEARMAWSLKFGGFPSNWELIR
jgi:hypothetical protein